jgi:hypothetical protein
VLAGSSAVLVTALIVGGVALLDMDPLLVGALLGVVIFKPQFFHLLCAALLAFPITPCPCRKVPGPHRAPGADRSLAVLA